MTGEIFAEYNTLVFNDWLPSDLPITWNAKLQRTAGYCTFNTLAGQRKASISLSVKVLDSEERLRKTLGHEMCHAAQWLIDGAARPPHGPHFWRWARLFQSRVPGLEISTCHTYEIFYKYRYECEGCGHSFGRQSKSVDVSSQCCARCRGRLRLLGAFNRDGTPCQTREPSAFARFVKENFSELKKSRPTAAHGELMGLLGAQWRAQKVGEKGGEAGPVEAACGAAEAVKEAGGGVAGSSPRRREMAGWREVENLCDNLQQARIEGDGE